MAWHGPKDVNCNTCYLTAFPARMPGAFENTVVALYKYVVPKPKSECSKGEQLGVSFAAGYIAGVFCAIVSHPADNMVRTLGALKRGPAARAVCIVLCWRTEFPRLRDLVVAESVLQKPQHAQVAEPRQPRHGCVKVHICARVVDGCSTAWLRTLRRCRS